MLKSRGSLLLLFGLIFSARLAPPSELSVFAHPLPKPAFFLPAGGLSSAKPNDPVIFEVYRGRAPQAVSILPGERSFGSSSSQRVKKKASRRAAAPSGNAGGQFLDAPEYATGNGPNSVAAGDTNGDGKQDLAAANSSDNTVSILLGNGDGSFAAHIDYPTGKGPSSVAFADVNGDGKLDMIVANATDNTVSVLIGNGDGTFLPHSDFPAGMAPTQVTVADFNSDKKPDLAVVNPGSSTFSGAISVLIGNGDGTFQSPVSIPTAFPVAAAIGDLNGDGKADLVVANNTDPGGGGAGGTGSLTVFLGKGDGSFQTGVVLMLNVGPLSVAIADLNGDGVPDLIAPTTDQNTIPGPGSVTVLVGNGDGTFKDPQTYVTGHAGELSTAYVTTGDFNGDGHMDIAISSSSEDTVSVLLGKGDGSFRAQSTFGTGSSPFSVVAGDFNGDGQFDLVTPNSSGNSASVLLGNGDGTFQARGVFSVGANPNAIATGDFNGDGKADLVTVDLYSGASVLLGNGNGTFQQDVVYPSGGISYAVVVGDFNGDNKVDLATASANDNTVSVLLGNGDGTFQATVDYPIANQPTSLAGSSMVTTDFNGDGAPDLVVVGGGDVCLLLNTGVGTFQPTLDLGIAAQWLVSADFNGDGEADLAIATGTQVAVLLGNGDGTFKPPANVNGPGGSLAVGDLNGDGKADLVVFHNGISVLFGNGDGTFQTAVDYSTAEQTWAGSVGDFDGDGKNDIAALGSAGLTVFTNNGDGTFQASTNYGAGSGISGLAITDLDGDGKPDISVSNVAPQSYPPFLQGGTVSILLNGQYALVGLHSSTNPSDAGNPVTFTTSVKPASPGALVPGGTAALQDGRSVLGNATLTDGTATFPPVSLSAGTHQIVVSYSGDANFRPGSSGIRQVVIPPDFTVAVPGLTPASVSCRPVRESRP